MIGGVAKICSACSYKWTLSPAVSRSWFCPACGGARGLTTPTCSCSHIFDEHHTSQNVPPSLAASGIRLDEMHLLDKLVATKPKRTPKIGKCKMCKCAGYDPIIVPLAADVTFDIVVKHINHGSHGREIEVTDIDSRSARLTLAESRAILSIEGPTTIRIRSDRDASRTFDTTCTSPSRIVIETIAFMESQTSSASPMWHDDSL